MCGRSDLHFGGVRALRPLQRLPDKSGEFRHGGGERLATELGVPLLGCVPLDARLREAGDAGRPLVLADPGCEAAAAIAAVARTIDESRAGGFTRTLPLVS